jgi:hypothetical protein
VSKNVPTFHTYLSVWNLPLQCQNFHNKVIFESKFGRENSYSIYSNVREFPSVVYQPFP